MVNSVGNSQVAEPVKVEAVKQQEAKPVEEKKDSASAQAAEAAKKAQADPNLGKQVDLFA